MLNIVSYIAILENADRILRNFGPNPDTESSEYINAYTIYETAFAELMRTGVPYTVRGDIVVIETDGKEYRYLYSDASGQSLSKTGIFDVTFDQDVITYAGNGGAGRYAGRRNPAEDDAGGSDIDLPPEMDEDEMEAEHPSDDVRISDGSTEDYTGNDLGTYDETGEEVLTAEEEFGPELEDNPDLPAEEDGDGGTPYLEKDGDVPVSDVIGEEDEDYDPEPDDGQEPREEEDLNEPSAVSEEYDTSPEEPVFSEPSEPDIDDTEDVEPPSEMEFGPMDMSEPALEEEDPASEFGDGGDEDGKDNGSIIEKVETEQDEPPYENREMPTSMAENDFTMSRHQLIFERNGKELGKTVVFTAPMSLDDPETRIIVGILTNGKIAVYITERGKSSIKVNTRWIPIVVTGEMEDGEYRASCSITEDYENMGYSLTDMPAFFGKRGHIVMDDDSGKMHVHIFPALSKNLPNGLSHFCYCIEYDGKIQVGSSLKSIDSTGHVYFSADGYNYDMIATWEKGKFGCYIKES